MNLHDIREDYSKQELSESHCHANPLMQFQAWLNDAITAQVNEPTAMNIATIDENGRPSSRMVLLKEVNDDGFVFFSNYHSRKGKALSTNPFISITFFWPELERQVRIEGRIEKLDKETSEAYFHSRPKGSQLGAVVSPQSSVIPNREFLENKLKDLEKEYENKEIPRPEDWGGYLAKPYEIEFWQGRPNRLHDRIIYELQEDFDWKISRLAP